MTTFRKIAVATDGSETALKAVAVAVDLAARYEAELLVFTAYQPLPRQPLAEDKHLPADVQWQPSAHEDVAAVLDRASELAHARSIEPKTVAREGEPARVICDLAEELGADLLVIGNKGMNHRLLGSVPNTVSHHAPCSIVIAKTT